MRGRVCIGVVVGAHGVKGAVRVKSFTERPGDIAAYGPVEDEPGRRRFALRAVGEGRGSVLVEIDGVGDRDAALALKGTRLFVPRAALPAAGEDEFYPGELVGLRAELGDGTQLGPVTGVFDFGAGDLIEVTGPTGAMLLPFTRAAVPLVDLAAGRVVVAPPSFAPDAPDEREGAADA